MFNNEQKILKQNLGNDQIHIAFQSEKHYSLHSIISVGKMMENESLFIKKIILLGKSLPLLKENNLLRLLSDHSGQHV